VTDEEEALTGFKQMQKNYQEISQIIAAAELENTQMNLAKQHATNILNKSQLGVIFDGLDGLDAAHEKLQIGAGDGNGVTALGASAFG